MDRKRLEQFIDGLPPMVKIGVKMILPKFKDEDLEELNVDLQILRNYLRVKDSAPIYYLIEKYGIYQFIPEIYDLIDSIADKNEKEN